MSHLSRWLTVFAAAFTPAVFAVAADARPQPSAQELIDGILTQESKIESVHSIYLRFEGKWTRSPDNVANHLAELRRRFSDVPIDVKQNTDLWPEMTEELELAFDQRRVRRLEYSHHDRWVLSVFDGERLIVQGKLFNAPPANQQSYALHPSPQRVFSDPFVDLVWLRIGAHQFWFSEKLTADRIAALDRQARSYVLAGQAEFRGRRCYMLDSIDFHQRLHVGIDDGRLYGSTSMGLPAGVDQWPAISKAAGQTFASDAAYRPWLDGLSKEEPHGVLPAIPRRAICPDEASDDQLPGRLPRNRAGLLVPGHPRLWLRPGRLAPRVAACRIQGRSSRWPTACS